jgi:hypothetical protein
MLKLRLFLIAVFVLGVGAGTAHALPSLQLGEGSVGDWVYDSGTQTWVVSDTEFELNALANAERDDGGKGSYAWDSSGSITQTAYLVVSVAPKMIEDGFDITVMDSDGITISLLDSGFGTPPLQDPNSLAPHGIFDTYFEIYEFEFDGAIQPIYNTQDGILSNTKGAGYLETLQITINSLELGVDGVHFDLMTLTGDGSYDVANGGGIINSFAPFSHDAEFGGSVVPEPTSAVLFLVGSLVVGHATRRTGGKAQIRA